MLSAEALRNIDREIAKFPAERRRSAVIAALAIAQDEKGWLSTEVMDFVAQLLEMPPIAVYEVASFYEMYNLTPVGKYKITLCTNLPCALSGANATAEFLKHKLGITFNQTTADGRVTLKEGQCFGACGDAPVFLLNNKKMYGTMSPEKTEQFLTELD